MSTGNIIPIDVRRFHGNGKPYPIYFTDEEACILDPGQAALALTVGSIAATTLAVGQVAHARAIALQDHPSPFTRSGPGIRQEIKPELTDYGGNYLIEEEGGQVRLNPGLGVAVASHRLTPALRHDSGTSLAAPRATHKLALVLRDLRSLEIEPSADLLKAFMVNSAQYSMADDDLKAFREAVGAAHFLNVLGYGKYQTIYGLLIVTRTLLCSSTKVKSRLTRSRFLDIPVPPNLQQAGRDIKRLTVTVAYSPEVQRWGLERYLGTSLKWRVFRGDVLREDVITAMSVTEEDESEQPAPGAAAQAEELGLPNELGFKLGITKRSRGTVQHDIAEWNIHKPEFSANNYTFGGDGV